VRLYIVRHGIAVPHGTPGVEEDDRPLTQEGIKKTRQAAEGLQAIKCFPEIILSSPLPRAKQTAEIVLETLGKHVPIMLIDALSPKGSRQELYMEIRQRQNSESLMLVGHQPSLGEIAGDIAWGSPEHYLELKKGGACALEIEAVIPKPRGTLLWLLPPSILRDLG
jgi:phosphohistidine phosphatase